MNPEETQPGGISREALSWRVRHLEHAVDEIRDATKQIAEAMQTLAVLEERHAQTRDALERAFGALESHEDRLRKIENRVPEFRRTVGWVNGAVIAIVAGVGSALMTWILG